MFVSDETIPFNTDFPMKEGYIEWKDFKVWQNQYLFFQLILV